MELAPIVLFAYNRPWHTEQTLEALSQNELANQSKLYIYCDGPKVNATQETLDKIKEVRQIIGRCQWCKNVHIVERKKNIGLADSIISGVTKIINKYGKVIVLEDDIVTSKFFLRFMNEALNLYQNDDKVMHISAYMYPHNKKIPSTFFSNVTLCWGWATWKNAWKHYNNDHHFLWSELNERGKLLELNKFGKDYLSRQLVDNITGRIKTWFIKWNTSVLLKGGFTLFPKTSFVNNIGFDSSGVHNGTHQEFRHNKLSDYIKVYPIPLEENELASKIFYEFYKNLGKVKFRKKPILASKIFLYKCYRKAKSIVKNSQDSEVSLINSYLGNHTKIYPKARVTDSIIGNYTYISVNSNINRCIVGKFCSIGPNFCAGWGVHPIDGISTHPMFYSRRRQNGITLSRTNKIKEVKTIYIGNDVFIGMNVILLDGIRIGDGAIIGAGAVVSKDIPPFSIAVGNPIRIIKNRFTDEVCSKLKKIKWWDFPEDELKIIEELFFDIEKFIAYSEEKNTNFNSLIDYEED